MTKVLVTGGAGVIGSHVVDNLIESNYEVVVIDDLSNGKEANINKQARFYKLDITEKIELLEEVFKKESPEFVIHMAAQILLRKSIEFPFEDAKINILGTINILELCRKHNVRKIIYTSTAARFGDPKYLPVDEKHPLNPTSPYGISKYSAEHYVEMYAKVHGLDYTIFCFGNVYGPRDDPSSKHVIPMFAQFILNNQSPIIFGDGNQTRDFIYVKDIAEFIVKSLTKSTKSKIFYLANGKQISINRIFSILKEISGFDKEPIHKEAILGEVRDIHLDTSLVRNELGWNPKTPFEQGLRETFYWLKENIKN